MQGVSVRQSIRTSGVLCVHSCRAESRGDIHSLLLCVERRMAFGLDFTGANVSEINSFYSGHYWPALDMNDNYDYAQDSSRGE